VGGQYRDVCGRSIGGRGNRLVGSVLPANVWALASGTVTRGFFRHPRADRCTAKKGVRNRTCAHGGAGASASERLQNPPGSEPATPESRMIERKLKIQSCAALQSDVLCPCIVHAMLSHIDIDLLQK